MSSLKFCFTPPRQKTIVREAVLCPKKRKFLVNENLSMLSLMHSDSNAHRSLINDVMNADDDLDFKNVVTTPKKTKRKKKMESSSSKQPFKTEVEAESDVFDDAPPTMMRIAIPRSRSSMKKEMKYKFESTDIDGVMIPMKKKRRRRESKDEVLFYRCL